MAEHFRLIFTTETELGAFKNDIIIAIVALLLLSLLLLLCYCYLITVWVLFPLKILNYWDLFKGRYSGQTLFRNDLDQKWLLLCQESYAIMNPLPYPLTIFLSNSALFNLVRLWETNTGVSERYWLLWWLNCKESCSSRRCGFDPGVGKIPWRRAWQSTPVFLPGESRGQRSLVGYSPWGYKELDTAKTTSTSIIDTGI